MVTENQSQNTLRLTDREGGRLTVKLLDGVLPVLGIVDDVVIVLRCSVTPSVGRLVPVRPERSLSFPVIIFLQVSDAAPSEADLGVEHGRGLEEGGGQGGEGQGGLHTQPRLALREGQQFTPPGLQGDAAQTFNAEHGSEKIS